MTCLPGVYSVTRKDGSVHYRSSITISRKHISLGTYPSETEANTAYQEASKLLDYPDFNITDYAEQCSILSFSKWISLINYLKTGYYIKNPIILKDTYFIYYLDQETAFKFDVDDLFYYSHHKIMKRGGHLFVSDFGMQVNILSRYGIRNFAVCGRDYIFVNGDATDFRYKNIQVINKYYGVQRFVQNGLYRYLASIHINGNYQVGIYETEVEAAVAYNKAVDTMRQKGIQKNFPTNYIIEIDEIAYSSLYTKIKISKKLRDL